MSPEQAAGGRVLDPRSDVYSLGATLYELLTARPAFGGDDRAELLRRIAHAEPVAPSRLDPSIPRDLETIVGKAMAREPERRYATARELAEDLARFLDDRPILARRPGPVERLGRWSRRHGRATAVAAAVLVAATAASTLGLARLWEEQGRTTPPCSPPARPARTSGRRCGSPSSPRTRSPTGPWRGSPRPPRQRDADEQARDRAFCRAALPYYEEIVGRYRGDPEMVAIVAAAEHRTGFIRMLLGEPGAEDAIRRSIDLYRALIAASPRDPRLRSSLCLTYNDHIILLRKAGRTAEVLGAFPALLDLRRWLAEEDPGDSENLISLTLLQAEYAGLLEAAGRVAERRSARRREIGAIYRLADDRGPHESRPAQQPRLDAGRPGRRRRRTSVAAAIELAEQAVAMAPAVGNYWNTLGVAHYRAGEWSQAADALEESIRLRSGGDPYDWLFLAMARHRLGDADGPGTGSTVPWPGSRPGRVATPI